MKICTDRECFTCKYLSEGTKDNYEYCTNEHSENCGIEVGSHECCGKYEFFKNDDYGKGECK